MVSQMFAIFWQCEMQFGNSRWFCQDCEGNKPQGTLRWWACLILSGCYIQDLPLQLEAHTRFASTAWSTASKCTVLVKFLEQSGYCTVINCTFIFCTTNIFGCFCHIMTQFDLVKHIAHSSNLKQRSNAQSFSAPQWIPSTAWTASVPKHMLCKLACTKILKNFWLTLVIIYTMLNSQNEQTRYCI